MAACPLASERAGLLISEMNILYKIEKEFMDGHCQYKGDLRLEDPFGHPE